MLNLSLAAWGSKDISYHISLLFHAGLVNYLVITLFQTLKPQGKNFIIIIINKES